VKKTIDKRSFRFSRNREIWWCSLGINVGFEQDGTGEKYDRPVLIIKSLNRYVCIIVPITTSQETGLHRISIGILNKKECYAVISQLRLIDARRLKNKIKTLNQELFDPIENATKDLL
jgi:mRNA-degrading endonuclease toxin of MazEF toxin-antitoxin module